MSKSKRKLNDGFNKTYLWFFLIVMTIAFFIHVYNVKSLKNATSKKAKLIEQIKTLQSEIDELIIEKQKLVSHDRIEKYAKEKLGLVPNLSINEKIIINKKELEFIKRIVDEKYE